jgi:hypothetical protein
MFGNSNFTTHRSQYGFRNTLYAASAALIVTSIAATVGAMSVQAAPQGRPGEERFERRPPMEKEESEISTLTRLRARRSALLVELAQINAQIQRLESGVIKEPRYDWKPSPERWRQEWDDQPRFKPERGQ